MPNFVEEFERLIQINNSSGCWENIISINYLYENRNNMTKEEFEECVRAYGYKAYREG